MLKTASQAQEERLIARAVQGDREAFGELYERYVDRIYSYIYYRVGNPHDAEDLTSRVFFRAMRHIERYDHRGLPFSAWLYRIAHNLVANWYRDNSRRQEIALDDLVFTYATGEHPEWLVMNREEQEELLAVIRTLPEDRQQLLYLKFGARLSNAEIAQVLGRTEGAVKSLYHRTLTALRAEFRRRQQNGRHERLKR